MRLYHVMLTAVLFLSLGIDSLTAQQQYFFDNFSQPNSGCSGIPSFRFPDPSFPQWNWGWTHGSPSSSASPIFMFHKFSWGRTGGEGIFTNFHFLPNTKYVIRLTVAAFDLNSKASGAIHLRLLPSSQNNTGCPPNYGDPIPSTITSPSGLTILEQVRSTNITNETIQMSFVTGQQDFRSLVIFPEDLDNQPSTDQVSLIISCIEIIGFCNEQISYETYSQSIPTGIIERTGFHVGSSFGSSTNLVKNGIAPTELKADEFALFKENTLITPKEENTCFLAHIDRCTNGFYYIDDFEFNPEYPTVTHYPSDNCSGIATKPSGDKGSEVSPDGNGEVMRQAVDEHETGLPENSPFNVHPNPTSGKFKIEFTPGNTVGVEVLDIQGRVVAKLSPTGGNTIHVDISDQPNGIYLVRVITNEKTCQKKILKN